MELLSCNTEKNLGNGNLEKIHYILGNENPKKTQKNPPPSQKNLLYSRKWNSKIRKFLIFSQGKTFCIFSQKKPPTHFGLSSQEPALKKFLVFSKKVPQFLGNRNLENVHGHIVLSGWNTHLDLLYQKSILYQHHWENYVTSLLEGFIPSGLSIKKRPVFQAVSDNFEREWNSILYDTSKRLVELLLKESEEAVSVFEAEIQVEIERSDSTSEILEDLQKKHKEYNE